MEAKYELLENVAKFICRYTFEDIERFKSNGKLLPVPEWRRVPVTFEAEDREYFIASSHPRYNWPNDFRSHLPLRTVSDYMVGDVVFGEIKCEEGTHLHSEYTLSLAKKRYKFTEDYSKLDPEERAKIEAKLARKKTLGKSLRRTWDDCLKSVPKNDPRELHLYTPESIRNGFFA